MKDKREGWDRVGDHAVDGFLHQCGLRQPRQIVEERHLNQPLFLGALLRQIREGIVRSYVRARPRQFASRNADPVDNELGPECGRRSVLVDAIAADGRR